MFKNTIFRRMTALVLTLALAAAAALPGLAVYPMPIQTASETEAVYLFNADTGKTILNQNADQQQYVASLTKLMTALLLLESGKDLNGEVTVPTALTQELPGYTRTPTAPLWACASARRCAASTC